MVQKTQSVKTENSQRVKKSSTTTIETEKLPGVHVNSSLPCGQEPSFKSNNPWPQTILVSKNVHAANSLISWPAPLNQNPGSSPELPPIWIPLGDVQLKSMNTSFHLLNGYRDLQSTVCVYLSNVFAQSGIHNSSPCLIKSQAVPSFTPNAGLSVWPFWRCLTFLGTSGHIWQPQGHRANSKWQKNCWVFFGPSDIKIRTDERPEQSTFGSFGNLNMIWVAIGDRECWI